MPKIVDHDARRREFVEAALRVVTTEGFGAVSVRRVAEESACSPSSLRYYFSRQEDLITAVLEQVATRAGARLVPRIVDLETAGPGTGVTAACALLEELIPLDARRRTEWAVWSALTDPPATPPGLGEWRTAGWAGTRHHCRRVVDRLSSLEAEARAGSRCGTVPAAWERPQRERPEPATAARERSDAAARSAPTGMPEVPTPAQMLESARGLTPLADPTAEARAAGLHSVLDGLSLQLVAFRDELEAEEARGVLRQVLDDLASRVG